MGLAAKHAHHRPPACLSFAGGFWMGRMVVDAHLDYVLYRVFSHFTVRRSLDAKTCKVDYRHLAPTPLARTLGLANFRLGTGPADIRLYSLILSRCFSHLVIL